MPTWVRVRDASTGHEYDVAERVACQLRDEGLVVLVDDVPAVSGEHTRPRPPKHAEPAPPAAVKPKSTKQAPKASSEEQQS